MQIWHPTIRRLIDAGPFLSSGTFGDGLPSISLSAERFLSSSTSSPTSLQIDEVWLFDDVHHAASIDLNAGKIGSVHAWSDGGRDIVNFLQHVYDGPEEQYGDQGIMGWSLSRHGKRGKRKVIGLGHSVGGNAL